MNTNVQFIERVRFRLKKFQHKILKYRLTTRETIVADTEYGQIRGVKRNTVYNDSYYSFEGIPFARPPVGILRFKAPEPPTPWQDVLDCTNNKDTAIQVQFVFNQVEGSEDCLYLNVYTKNPNLAKDERRPVMVFIHGGGFIMGEANREWYGPDFLIQKDVVLVTISYRLGVLGFLSLEDQKLNVPGNAGLKDQVMALKWVKNNCANFGGDSDCITVFGESAGSASTHYMLLTNQTRDLFHRAILMSGNAYAPWSLTDCTKRAYTIAKLAGYKGENDESEILKFLMKVDPKSLVRVEERVLTSEEQRDKVLFAFGPTVEPYHTPDCVLPQPTKELMKYSWGNSVPVLTGNTSFEGLFCLPLTKLMPDCIKELDTCYHFVPSELAASLAKHDEIAALGLKLKQAHVSGKQATAAEYLDFYSQFWFWFPTHRFIQARHKYAATAPTYLYRYDFDGEVLVSPFRIMRYGRGVKGVSHADDLGYLFWNFLSTHVPVGSRDYINMQRSVSIWTQFAATGNPYSEHIPGMSGLNWQPLKSTDAVYKCFNISDELQLIDLPEMQKIKAFESIYDNRKDLLF